MSGSHYRTAEIINRANSEKWLLIHGYGFSFIMTDKQSYIARIEKILFEYGSPLPEHLCKEFSGESIHIQNIYARAFKIAGCKGVTPVTDDFIIEEERVQAACIILLALSVGTGEPRWSSWLIERMWESILDVTGGQFSDLFKALLQLLKEGNYKLTRTMVFFIEAITYAGRIELLQSYRSRYAEEDFSWMLQATRYQLTAAQAYLIAHAIPYKYLSDAELAIRVLKASLSGEIEHELWKVLAGRFYDALHSEAGIRFLEDWLDKGIEAPYREDIIEIISPNTTE